MVKQFISLLLAFTLVISAFAFSVVFSAEDGDDERPLYGDINGDGKVKGNDSTLLLKYFADWRVDIDSFAADCNGDGKIKGSDATLLLKYLADWKVYLGPLTFGNIYILGDSTSTYEGWIPAGNRCYFLNDYSFVEEEKRVYYNDGEYYTDGRTDLINVNQTWWYSLAEETDSRIMLNDSYSGSTNSYTGYGYITVAEYEALSEDEQSLYSPIPGDERYYSEIKWREESLIGRFVRLAESGYFDENRIDTVFIYGGSNDNDSGYIIGKPKYGDFTEADLYQGLPATCYLIDLVKKTLPDTRIVFILECQMGYALRRNAPVICEHYGIDFVELEPYERINGHATVSGMEYIKNRIISALSN